MSDSSSSRSIGGRSRVVRDVRVVGVEAWSVVVIGDVGVSSSSSGG